MNLSNEAILIITLLAITILPCAAILVGILTGSLEENSPSDSSDKDWDY